MGLDRTLGCSQCAADLLVGAAANDTVDDQSLAWRQSPETGARAVQFVLQSTCSLMVLESLFNRAKEVVGRYRLGEKVIRTRLDGLHCGGNIGIAREEYD